MCGGLTGCRYCAPPLRELACGASPNGRVAAGNLIMQLIANRPDAKESCTESAHFNRTQLNNLNQTAGLRKLGPNFSVIARARLLWYTLGAPAAWRSFMGHGWRGEIPQQNGSGSICTGSSAAYIMRARVRTRTTSH